MHAFFASRSELYSNRINLDELTLLDPGDSDPPRYRARVAEIGCLIGAKKLGYQLADIPPGESFCPTHWHCVEEELFFVWEGTPTLLTPRGAFELRPGDFVAFPIGPAGAHKLTNESAKPCRVILLAAESEHDVCFYPDSGKIGVFPQRLLVRTEPALDYYDGEG